MATHMQTFTMIDIGKTAIVDKPIPIPGPNDALVRTTAALICTSDVHTVAGALPVENGRTLGHESVGVIEALGSDVNGFHVGQRVAVNAVTPCWTCSYCQGGYSSQCQGLLGGYKYTAQVDGNMAEYFLVPGAQANLALIPDELPDEAAVYACDMLSTGFTGAENAQIKIGDTVVIFAQGSVGLCATMGPAYAEPAESSLSKRFPNESSWRGGTAPTTSLTTGKAAWWSRSSNSPEVKAQTPPSRHSGLHIRSKPHLHPSGPAEHCRTLDTTAKTPSPSNST
ncbi:hypothetical protein GCM10020255_021570 [Rhodococcus baikonurensis]